MDPRQPVLEDGGLVVRDGLVEAIGPWKEVGQGRDVHDLGAVTLVPGLINAHTHLGLSHLAGRIPAGLGFMAWADRLFACLREPLDPTALAEAVSALRASGTVCVADVLGSGGEVIRHALDMAGLYGLFFQEYAGRARAVFSPRPLPDNSSLGIHALYSTDPVLAQAVKDWCTARGRPFTLHLAEVPGENELCRSGAGPLAEFLRLRRVLPKSFRPCGQSAVAWAYSLGLLDSQTLAVHCVHLDEADIKILAQSRAHACLCPRSNAWIQVGTAPVAKLLAAGVPICIGTDSLASNTDLDLWAELRALRQIVSLPLAELLPLVTKNPARVLGLDRDYGSLAPGKRASWAVVPSDICLW